MNEGQRERPDGYEALPKRFRDYIGQLETRLRSLSDSLPTRALTCIEVVDYFASDNERVYLPDKTKLRFYVGRERFDVCMDDDGIKVTTEWQGLSVNPEASNVVVITSSRK